MGNFNSAYFKDLYAESAICADNSVASRPSTPLPTPRHNRSSAKDPRSPSNCIYRTPIEVASCSRDPVPPVKALNELNGDPRSPSYGIDRTPIQIIKAVDSHEDSSCELESTSYLETDFDLFPAVVYDVAELTQDLDGLSTSSSPTVELVAATIPASVEDDVSPPVTDIPKLELAEALLQFTTSNEKLASKEKKLIPVTDNPPSHKENSKLRNKENRLIKTPLSKADKLFIVPKARTPLSTMSSHNNSPLQIVRGKQLLNQMQSTPPNSGEHVWQAIGN